MINGTPSTCKPGIQLERKKRVERKREERERERERKRERNEERERSTRRSTSWTRSIERIRLDSPAQESPDDNRDSIDVQARYE
jgi:hypothetical protein